jgi:hypothetical protein
MTRRLEQATSLCVDEVEVGCCRQAARPPGGLCPMHPHRGLKVLVAGHRGNGVRSRWPGSRGDLIGEAGEAAAGVETADVERNPGPGSAAHAPLQVGSTGSAERRTEYQHLAPLHARYAALPEGHADREQVRVELIAGYLPVARNIARKYGYRGENPDDVEQVASVGLVLAVDRFEPKRGVDFLSFAVPTITG